MGTTTRLIMDPPVFPVITFGRGCPIEAWPDHVSNIHHPGSGARGLILRKCDFQQSVAWPGLHPHNTIAPPSQGHWVDLLCTTRLRPWQAGPWQAAAASVALPGLHPDNNIPQAMAAFSNHQQQQHSHAQGLALASSSGTSQYVRPRYGPSFWRQWSLTSPHGWPSLPRHGEGRMA